MRKIKFRCLDTDNNKIVEPVIPIGVSLSNINFLFNNIKNRKWLQYTGIKDKNGKEIYEGDVCRIEKEYTATDFHYDFEIKWDKIGWSNLLVFECEVIGNIYENPELIK